MLHRLSGWTLPFALVFALAQAADDSKDVRELQKQATRLDNEASQGQEAVFESLSKQLDVPVATLQDQQKTTNFGFGQLFIANSLAAASGKTFEEISQEFQSGKGWGEIAKENDLKLGKVISDMKRANAQVQRDRTEQTKTADSSTAASGRSHQDAPRGPHGPSGSPPAKGRR
jgi:hypothetical protein